MRTRLPRVLWLCLAVALALAAPASANAGTPLMWAAAFHLLVGNIFIGLLEDGVLARFFRIRAGRGIYVMIAANYFSAVIGFVLLNTGGRRLWDTLVEPAPLLGAG